MLFASIPSLILNIENTYLLMASTQQAEKLLAIQAFLFTNNKIDTHFGHCNALNHDRHSLLGRLQSILGTTCNTKK